MTEWIGVDLDGTLAKFTEWQEDGGIGEPIQPMIDRVKDWLKNGQEVRIMTARANAKVIHPSGFMKPLEPCNWQMSIRKPEMPTPEKFIAFWHGLNKAIKLHHKSNEQPEKPLLLALKTF